MAFDTSTLTGLQSASYISTLNTTNFTNNNNGTYTLTSIYPQSSFQDGDNSGFPSVLAPHNLGLPGSPAFTPGDITGESISTYGPTQTIIETRDIDYQGNVSSTYVAYQVVAYNPTGYIAQLINGFTPVNPVTGTYVGNLLPNYLLISTSLDVNTYNAGVLETPHYDSLGTQVFEPLSFNFACFASGGRIATPGGWALVEDLAAGDLVRTASGADRAVVWHGRRAVDCRRHPDPRAVRPVRIEAGAFGAAPERALLLSPDHAVLVDGVLIPVKRLVDGAAIRQLDVDAVTYHHIELETHDVILAEGLPCESFLDTGAKPAFEGAGALRLHPDFSVRAWEAQGCAELVVAGPALDRARARLAEIAAERAREAA